MTLLASVTAVRERCAEPSDPGRSCVFAPSATAPLRSLSTTFTVIRPAPNLACVPISLVTIFYLRTAPTAASRVRSRERERPGSCPGSPRRARASDLQLARLEIADLKAQLKSAKDQLVQVKIVIG